MLSDIGLCGEKHSALLIDLHNRIKKQILDTETVSLMDLLQVAQRIVQRMEKGWNFLEALHVAALDVYVCKDGSFQIRQVSITP